MIKDLYTVTLDVIGTQSEIFLIGYIATKVQIVTKYMFLVSIIVKN